MTLLILTLLTATALANAKDFSLEVVYSTGKGLYGTSYAKNWKPAVSGEKIPDLFEVATGDHSFICGKTPNGQNVLIFPNSRLKVSSTQSGKDRHPFQIDIYWGAIMVNSPTKKHQLVINNGEGLLEGSSGMFFAIKDNKLHEYVFGSINQNATYKSQKRLGEEGSIALATREYLHSNDLSKKSTRKFSWPFQKNIKSVLLDCKQERLDKESFIKTTKSFYTLLFPEGKPSIKNKVEK